ncbi:MAG: hypothetical protein IJQ28_04685, partial [Clostridia bacterium]|nr:hypothetical protein [Clostridia bacterium]
MKKYPYADSTELIAYRPKIKKHRFRKLAPFLLTAFLASAITAGAVGIGGYFWLKPIVKTQSVSYNTPQNEISGGASTVLFTDGKKALSVTEIA